MCNPTALMIASTGSMGLQAYGTVEEGKAAKARGEYEAAMSRDEAQAEAAAIRRVGERQRGQTLAAIAASGVKIGEGSALDAERQVLEDYTRDEYMALLTGERRAGAARRAARDARNAANLNAVSSLLSAGANYARAAGWGAPKQMLRPNRGGR